MSPKVNTADMRQCPQCAELVQRQALKCRYCQSDIAASATTRSEDNTNLFIGLGFVVILIVLVAWIS